MANRKRFLASLLRSTLGFGAAVWVLAFILTDIPSSSFESGLGQNYSWDFREALVLFIFGAGALCISVASIVYVVRWICNLLRGSFVATGEPSWGVVVILTGLLVAQLISFGAIPRLKIAALSGYHEFRALDERSTYDMERDTAIREYLQQKARMRE